MKVDEKTNEITAIPELIKEIDILGCITQQMPWAVRKR